MTRDIREAILRAGFSWEPYVLRAYCDTNMIIAESKGKISHPYLQFIMGHKGNIEAYRECDPSSKHCAATLGAIKHN